MYSNQSSFLLCERETDLVRETWNSLYMEQTFFLDLPILLGEVMVPKLESLSEYKAAFLSTINVKNFLNLSYDRGGGPYVPNM